MSNIPPTLIVAVIFLAIVIVRQFAPLAATIAGLLTALGVGVWAVFGDTSQVGFLGKAVPRPVFIGLAILLFLVEALNVKVVLRRRQRQHELNAD